MSLQGQAEALEEAIRMRGERTLRFMAKLNRDNPGWFVHEGKCVICGDAAGTVDFTGEGERRIGTFHAITQSGCELDQMLEDANWYATWVRVP